MKRLTSIILFLPLLFACISEDAIHPSIKSDEKRAFLIEEAKTGFEEFYSECVNKPSQNFSVNKLSPGDFTPLWSENRYYESENYATYEISIDAERRISALYATIQKGKAVAKKNTVVQKLIVSKNTDSGIISFFIVNMIPLDKCSETSVYLSSLSGLVIYTRIADNAIFRVDKFFIRP